VRVIPDNFFKGSIYSDSFFTGNNRREPVEYPRLENGQVLNLAPFPHKRFATWYDQTRKRNHGDFGGGTWDSYPALKTSNYGLTPNFDGVDDKVTFPIVTTKITNVCLGGRCSTQDYTQTRQPIICLGNGGRDGYGMTINHEKCTDGSIRILYGCILWYDTGVDIIDKDWHHIMFNIMDDGSPEVYHNGNKIYVGAANLPNTPSAGVGVGHDNQTGVTAYFNGFICNVCFYDQILGASKIHDHYIRA